MEAIPARQSWEPRYGPAPVAARAERRRAEKGAIGRLFRAAVKAVTQRDTMQQPRRSSRRRSGESGQSDRTFRRAAKPIIRRTTWVSPYAAAASFLSDTLDWLHLWHKDTAGSGLDSGISHTGTNHLFPHP